MASLILNIETNDNGTVKVKQFREEVGRATTGTKGFSSAAKEHNTLMTSVSATWGSASTRMKGMVSSWVAMAAASVASVGALRHMVTASIEAEQHQVKLRGVLESTGGAAGMTLTDLNNLADGLAKVTTYSRGSIQEAEALALTFTRINKDVFPETIEAAMNMSAVTGKDLQSSMMQLGKAINNPVQGMMALREVGVSFTASQIEQIKALEASGKLYEQQKMILKELNTEFGNQERLKRNTLGGSFSALKNEWNSLFKMDPDQAARMKLAVDSLVKTLASPEIKAFARLLREDIVWALTKIAELVGFISQHTVAVKILVSGATGGAIGGLAGGLTGVIGGSGGLSDLWDSVKGAYGEVTGDRKLANEMTQSILRRHGRAPAAGNALPAAEAPMQMPVRTGPSENELRAAALREIEAQQRRIEFSLTTQEATARRLSEVEKAQVELGLLPAVEALENQQRREDALLQIKIDQNALTLKGLGLQEETPEVLNRISQAEAERTNLMTEQLDVRRQELALMQARNQEAERQYDLAERQHELESKALDLSRQRYTSEQALTDVKMRAVQGDLSRFGSLSGEIGMGGMGAAIASGMTDRLQASQAIRDAEEAIRVQNAQIASNEALTLSKWQEVQAMVSGTQAKTQAEQEYTQAVASLAEQRMALRDLEAQKTEMTAQRERASWFAMAGAMTAGLDQMAAAFQGAGAKGFAAYKAFAMVSATIKAIEAAIAIRTAILSSPTAMFNWMSNAALAQAMFGTTLAFGMAQVGMIAAQQPPAMHTGGPVTAASGWRGARPDEVIITAQKGEYMLSRDDVAGIRGGRSRNYGAVPDIHLTVIPSIDKTEILATMGSEDGERVIAHQVVANHGRGNSPIRQMIRGRG